VEIQANLKLFKILGDDTRLKLLAILRKSEFTVSELVHILGLHQSNISRHLTQLRDAKLVQDRREGTLVYYRWSEKLNSSNEISSLILSAWTNHDEKILLDSKMNEALELRKSQSKSFFDLVAGQYQEIAQVGGGAQGLIHAMALLIQSRCAADIGCGEGYLSQTLAMNCKSVIAVDQSQKMLDVLIENSDKDGIFNIDARLGDIEDLPIQAAECDLLFFIASFTPRSHTREGSARSS
jgi:ArsR family transcriptional regulator